MAAEGTFPARFRVPKDIWDKFGRTVRRLNPDDDRSAYLRRCVEWANGDPVTEPPRALEEGSNWHMAEWSAALDEIAYQVRDIARDTGTAVTTAGQNGETAITLKDQVTVQLRRPWPGRRHGLIIRTAGDMVLEFSGYGAPPAARLVVLIVRSLLGTLNTEA